MIDRTVRKDARRNRERVIDAARGMFAGGRATPSFDAIAREAGVGVGTVYRHFPSREALIEAVYEAELDDLTDAVGPLLSELPPADALREWMRRYARFFTTKSVIIDTLRAGWSSGSMTTPATRERITAAVATIVAAGVDAGSLRADVDPDDITGMVLGALMSTGTDDPAKTDRMLSLIADAVTAPAGAGRRGNQSNSG
ncbi:TetR/AcrR family transcriptional regulator [Williamsia serinedens]|nr:TetR/AcrR family transcriptional regulator [Williamsia serinedens]